MKKKIKEPFFKIHGIRDPAVENTMMETTISNPDPSAGSSKAAPEGGAKTDKGKEIVAEQRPFEVRYGTQSLGTPAFANILNQVTSINLDRTNYLLWQNIIIPILKSYKLEGHLSGKTPASEMTIIIPPSEDETSGFKIPNPEYDLWLVVDQLLVGWLYNSMTPEVATQVMGHDEAKPLWDSVQEYFGIQSRSQEDCNRLMLQQTRKGTMKMHEYLEKRYFDNLQVVGFPMDMRSYVSHVTAGLDDEYTPIVCVIRSQNLSWSEIQLELFSFGQRLERLQALKGNISVNLATTNLASVNIAHVERQTTNSQPSNFSHPNQNRGSSYNQNRGYNSNRGNRYQTRGRYSPYPLNNRPICQLCGKMGHTAVICHHRYDKADSHHVSSSKPNAPTPPAPQEPNVGNSTTLMAYPETLQDPSWYLDSGASNHVTTDFGKLTLKGTHLSFSKVVVDNGTKVPIQGIGSSYLAGRKRNLLLKDILLVPLMQKNLISISKLTQDNSVIVEFHDIFCFVKEKNTSEVCLVGKLDNGLYKLLEDTSVSGHIRLAKNNAQGTS